MKNNALEYKMSKKMFDNLLTTRVTESDKKMNPYNYVIKVINEQFGLKGKVDHVLIFDN